MQEEGAFQVIPAVDILGSEAVRLLRGDYDQVTVREPDPFALIERVAEAGAEIVHVVDLSAARTGGVRPELVARAVAAAAPARVQSAGGVRSPADAAALVAAGADRVVIGTAAFTSGGGLLDELVRALGERLVVAIDVRGGIVAIDGWTRTTSLSVPEAVTRVLRAGVTRLLCTAIEHDGTLAGPALGLLEDVCALSGLPVLAAGGIRSPDDLAAIEEVGCEGAVVGRALLQGLVPLTALGSRSDE